MQRQTFFGKRKQWSRDAKQQIVEQSGRLIDNHLAELCLSLIVGPLLYIATMLI